MTKNILVRAWKLLSWEAINESGQKEFPFGSDPVGTLTYTDNGYMSVAIMKSNRSDIGVAPDAIRKARWKIIRPRYLKALLSYFRGATTYFSYTGRYEIIGNRVVHYVEVSLIPDWVGEKQEREFELIDDNLIISSTTKNVLHRLIWRGT